MYAQKYKLDYISYGSDILSKQLETKFMSDAYSYSQPISLIFKKQHHLPNVSISPKLLKFKTRINMLNHTINSRDPVRYAISKQTRFYTPINKSLHLLIRLQEKPYNIGDATPHWLSAYEVIKRCHLPDVHRSMHLFEMFGDVVSALHHYLHPNKLDWHATIVPNSHNVLPTDTVNEFAKRFVTDKSIIPTLITKADLITCNCDTKLSEYDYLQLLVTGISLALLNMSARKTMIAKFNLPVYHPVVVSMLYTIYNCFDKIILYKGVSNQYSTDVWVIAKRFQGISENIQTTLNKLLSNKLDLDVDLYDNSYNEGFMKQLIMFQEQLINNYVLNIDKELFFVDNYDVLKNEDYDELIVEKNREWIEKMKIGDAKTGLF
jgi:hypothetical protein